MRHGSIRRSSRLVAASALAAAALCLAAAPVAAAEQSPPASKSMQDTPSSTQTQPGAAPSPGGQMQRTTTQPSLTRDQVVGKELRSANGETFGEIEDVVEEQGQVKAVLLDVGGFLGLGAKRVAVPVSQISPQGDHILAKGLTQAEVEKLPEHKSPARKGNLFTR